MLDLFQTLYQGSGQGLDQQQLVLDVEGTRVFLAPKEPGKRNQLWRMTSSGMLQVLIFSKPWSHVLYRSLSAVSRKVLSIQMSFR